MSNQQNNNNNNNNECVVIPASELRAENFVIYAPRINKKRNTVQALLRYNYNGQEVTPYIETPEALMCKFGLSNYKDGPSYNLPLSSYSRIKSEGPIVRRFFDEMMKLDRMMIDYGMEHSMILFKKQYTTEAQREIVESKYKPCIKQKINPKTGEPYPPGMAPRVPKVYDPDAEKGSHGVPDVEVYRSSSGEEPIDFGSSWEGLRELIPKETSTPLTLIFQPRIHFVGGFGISLRTCIVKIVEVQRQPKPTGWCFSRTPNALEETNDEEEVTREEVEAESSSPVQEQTDAASSGASNDEEDVEDSDGGETTDDDEEVEEVVE